MKTALIAAAAMTLGALLLAGNAQAQAQAEPGSAPETVTQPFPGIVVTPPRLAPRLPASGERAPPAAPPPQSCPDTGRKLELVS